MRVQEEVERQIEIVIDQWEMKLKQEMLYRFEKEKRKYMEDLQQQYDWDIESMRVDFDQEWSKLG